MANEQKTTMFDKNDIADIIYNSFLRALETNNVKLNQRDKLIETLISEVNKLGKVSEKEEAKMREAVQSGFKKGASVTTELQKYFKDLERAINNKEYKRSKVTEAYPQASRTFEQREDRLKKSSVSRFNRLNEKYIRLVKSVETNVGILRNTSDDLGDASRRLTKVTLNLLDKTAKVDENVSWLQNASQNITKSNEKATRLTRNLVGQSMKIDKEASWVESAVDNLRKSSRSLTRTSNKGIIALDRASSEGSTEKKQEEDAFIGKFVKKLESSKLGGLKNDILRLGGALLGSWVYKKTGSTGLAATVGLGLPAWAMTRFWGAKSIAKGGAEALLKTNTGQKLAYGAIGLLSKTKAGLPLAEKIAGMGAVKVGGGLLGKLIPGVGAGLFGIDAANRFKKGDNVGGLIASAGAIGSGMSTTVAGAAVGEPLALIAGLLNITLDHIKPISKGVSGLFNMFKPASQFIGSVFGGLWKHLTGLFKRTPPSIDKPSHPILNKHIVQPFQHSSIGKKLTRAALSIGGWNALTGTPINTTSMSRDKLLSSIGNNKYFEKLTGGEGYSIASGQMTHDIPYARAGTNAIYKSAFANIFSQSKYKGLKGRVQMTGALGTKDSVGIHNAGTASHFTGTKGDWVVMNKDKYDPEGTKLLQEALGSTNNFARVAPEATHADVQISKSAYDKYDASKKSIPPSVVGKTSYDPTGNSSAMIAMMTINYQGMA